MPRHSRNDFYNSQLQSESAAAELILVHHGYIINDLSKLLWSQKTSHRVKWRLRLKADYYLCSIKAASLINRSRLLLLLLLLFLERKQAALLYNSGAAAVDTSEKAAFFAGVELAGFVLCVLLIYSCSSLICLLMENNIHLPHTNYFGRLISFVFCCHLSRGTFCVRALKRGGGAKLSQSSSPTGRRFLHIYIRVFLPAASLS